MNKKQKETHKKYQAKVAAINELNKILKQRIARCEYLKRRGDTFKNLNREQAEAFYARINLHKPKMIEVMEQLEKLEKELEQMPKVWIV